MANIPNALNLPDQGRTTLSTLSVDGVPLEDLAALYDLNTKALGGQKWNSPTHFWATPPRHANSDLRDVLDVSLNSVKLINRFSWQMSKFPCRAWLQYFDTNRDEWRAVRTRKGKPVQVSITESVPRRISRGVRDDAHRHPHHRAAGHWHNVEIRTKPVRASRFRIVLAHLPSQSAPTEIGTRKAVPYSLAVKDFQMGYDAIERRDVPRVNIHTQRVDESVSFSSSVDLLGSPIEFSLTEYRASDLLWPTLQTLAGVIQSNRDGNGEVWKCEPQPVPYAVVNLYADARDALGQAQSIDRFYLNPTTSGVSCNLYYSIDDLDYSVGFEGSDEPIRYPGLRPHGVVTPGPDGILFSGTEPGFLDLDNKMIQLQDAAPWWVGMKFQPQFDSNSTDDQVLVSTPRIEVRWEGASFSWVIEADGVTITRVNNSFVFNQAMAITVAHEDGLVRVKMGDGWASTAFPAPGSPGRLPEAFIAANPELAHIARFGGHLVESTGDPGVGNYRLNGYVIKQEQGTDEILQEFIEVEPDDYLRPADIDEEERTYTRNALLRVLPYYRTSGVSSRNPYGFVGGPGTPYENLTWTPISRDFKLHKGTLKFDPVQAKFFKFEFTNLNPQPYSGFEPVARKVRLFTAETIARSVGVRAVQGLKERLSGLNINLLSSYRPLFSDQRRVQPLANPTRTYGDYTPTEALYSKDPVAQERLADLNPAFRLQPWRCSPLGAPRFVNTERHYYETVKINHNSNVAYFVGLSEIRMFKVDYTSADDTDSYLLPFHDRSGIDDAGDPYPWSIEDPSGLIAPETLTGLYAQSTSQPLLSRRNVRGVQFATTQTPARQLLTDAEFNDPELLGWKPYGGAVIEPSTDFNSDLGSTVKISRQVDGAFWEYVEERFPTWDSIEDLDPDPGLPTWDDVAAPPDLADSYGGITGTAYSLVQPAARGRLYAAARVYTPEALEEPLHLQLITSDGEVLSEESLTPQAGAVTEWYTGYTVGDAGDYSGVPTWDEVEDLDPSVSLPTWDGIEDIGTWDQVMGGIITPYAGPVTVRLFQSGPTDDVFHVDNLSIFEDPIIWEFSNDGGVSWFPAYDIRNNPDGVLLFPTTPEETLSISESSSLRWRVTSYRPGVRVTSLFIRPWYSTLRFGVMPSETLAHGGPNISKYDQYPSVADFAPFKAWSKPIPEDWWFLYRQWLLQGGLLGIESSETGIESPTVFLSDSFLYQGKALPTIILSEALVHTSPVSLVLGGESIVLQEAIVLGPGTVV